MAKIQTTINFLEKKKISERLRRSAKKDPNVKVVSEENENNISFQSPRKTHKTNVQNNFTSPSKHIELQDLYDKENEGNNKYIHRPNPSVVLHKTNSIQREVKEKTETLQHRSPLKRSSPITNLYLGDEDCSPPKRDCSDTHTTPSQLISNLELNSPEKIETLTRKQLFPKGEFDAACKALHSSAPLSLPGREDKLDFIKQFMWRHSEDGSSGTLYISGPPGTGKTACVNIAVADPRIMKSYSTVCLNCTSLNSIGSVYSRIVKELELKTSGSTEKAYLAAFQKYLHSKKRKMILIVLDELDQLCTTKQSVLYSVFEWPAQPDSRLVLVGIANALDLTDRVLPRLQAHLALQPTLLHFPSYTRQQIIDIISDRLRQAGVEEVFSGAALPLLASKVAAVNGDVRRALDIARRVVEMAERRTVLQPLSDNEPSKHTVALQEVMTVVSDVYSTAQTLDSNQAGGFPLQQKLLICSLLLLRQKSKVKDVTIGKLHEVYRKVCDRRNMSALDISEFISLASLVESRGVLRVTGKTLNRLSKIILQWDESEVQGALQDKQLLAAILSDKGVAV